MKWKPLRYYHESKDPLYEDRTVEIGGHNNPDLCLVGHKGRDPSIYIHVDDVESAIVALIAGTDYLNPEREGASERRVGLMNDFIMSFREEMVPTFRTRMRAAIDNAEDDWAAKCAVSSIIKEYEGLT